ncbi:hypothetical protein TASI_0785 [Taylorella asinigenitalis MCE3]|uniref:Uncharacterized protein n=1 Tax=Taylorella asinigenitalis (strain MCE3) TaxID=1008459 RepID=G4QB14_TAYAM|nr:hypothetical protein TASI_0785 [Taylorella asinigenitalis MCE3]
MALQFSNIRKSKFLPFDLPIIPTNLSLKEVARAIRKTLPPKQKLYTLLKFIKLPTFRNLHKYRK